jgi:hypothetical protein
MDNRCVDLEARKDLAELRSEVRQHSTDWWGPDKTNGKRSEVIELVDRVDDLEVKIKHYEDTREATCIGLRALDQYIASKTNEEAEMLMAKEKGKQLMMVQWVQVFGIVAVALIALLKR